MTRLEATPPIRLRGVRHNNLKNFDLDLPTRRLVVITGLSGSGKSSLAFDTLFAEGQRRYIETFSPYARQFFDRMDKPQVDRIEGIPPAIAIEQKNTVRTTRSTVGTMTELCDYMKLLWPHLARLHCQQCGEVVRCEPPQVVWERVNDERRMTNDECLITFDLPLSEKLSLEDSLGLLAKQGYQRLLLGDAVVRLEEALSRSSFVIGHSSLTVVQDRLRLDPANRARFIEACEQAYHFGKGRLAVHALALPTENSSFVIRHSSLFSAGFHCAQCDLDYREPTPALFSFNHPIGACPGCKGFGRVITIDYNLAIPDRSKSLAAGAVKPWQSGMSAECQQDLLKFCKLRKVPADVPFQKLPRKWQQWVLEGDPGYGKDERHQWPRAWYGVKGYFRWLESKAYKMHVRVLLSRYRAYSTCPDCQGRRLKPEALLYRIPIYDLRLMIDDLSPGRKASEDLANHQSSIINHQSSITLADFYALPVDRALAVIESLAAQHSLTPNDPLGVALNEVRSRLRYLVDVGLGYLTLDRPTRTLSGGETERVSLTTCLGTRLVNTLFVLDEPSVGLHPRDTARLVRILEHLRDTGNTVVVVEHEPGVIRAADQIVDLGPGSGEKGGQVVFQGPFKDLLRSDRSLTGQYLSSRKQIDVPPRRPVALAKTNDDWRMAEATVPYRVEDSAFVIRHSALRLSNAACHNLKNLSAEIPLNRFVCLTGVSGSGKTTLVREALLPALQERLKGSVSPVKASDRLDSEPATEDTESDQPSPVTCHAPLLEGWESLNQVVLVDQSPLGKTPRSNPVVYIGAFDEIRELFAQADLARQRGLNASAFSFNSALGQCQRCRGAGFEKVEMQFLSDVFIRCPDCNGRRYRDHVLEVKLKGAAPDRARRHTPRDWSIADLLEATVDDALEFLLNFIHLPAGRRALGRLKLLQDVGLGYLRLGQPIQTLSGGESQRLKLVSHLAESAANEGRQEKEKREKGERETTPFPTDDTTNRPTEPKRTLFLFDEPTTGLHFDDVRVLLQVFQRLVNAGHSLLVIEHNLDVIKCADWVIDLGPEAGERGGQLVVAGTPEDIAACDASHTGRFLREVLSLRAASPSTPARGGATDQGR